MWWNNHQEGNWNMVSVIVPIYNVEKYIDKCVHSIVTQSYRDLEIILVDDGSTDSSGILCDQFASQDSRIKVIHQNNRGLSGARNVGIEIAQGRYIGFVDSDDYIDSKMYEALVSVIEKENAELAICDVHCVNEDGTSNNSLNSNPLVNRVIHNDEIYELLNGFKYPTWKYVTAWNRLYKKELFESLRFEEGRLHEDEFIVHHIFSQCNKIVICENAYYYYVHRENSITNKIINSGFQKKQTDIIYALLGRYEFLRKNKKQKLAKITLRMIYVSLEKLINQCDKVEQIENEYQLVNKYFWKSFDYKLVVFRYKCMKAVLNKKL